MKKALIMLLVVLFPALTFTGCWDLNEPEDLALVSVVGFNCAKDNQIEMVIQDEILSPGGMQTPKSNWNFELHKSTGPTLYDAVQKNLKTNPQKVYFAHTKAIIISEEMARQQGIRPVVDFLERNPEIRLNTMLLISKKGEFEKIFLPDATKNMDSGKLMQKIVKGSIRDSYTFDSKLKDFMENYWGKYTNPYALGISATQSNLDGKSIDQGYDNSNLKTYNIDLGDIAVFKNDKMTGWLTGDKSRGFLFAKSKVEGGSVNINYQGKPISIRIARMKSEIKPTIENGQVKININVNLDTDLGESIADIDLDDKNVIINVGKVFDEQVKDEIKKAIDGSKNLSTDVFGFGNRVFENCPDYWKQHGRNWSASYSKLDVSIRVTSNLLHIGLAKKPAKNAE